MKLYKIHQSHNDSYTNHQMVKELFPGDGKILFQVNGDSVIVNTDIELSPEFVGDKGIEYIGQSENFISNSNDNLFFSIRLNGCKTVKNKRRSLPKNEIDEWVNIRLSDIGADILSKNIIDEGVNISFRQGSKMFNASILVVGMLRINNKEKFNNVINFGIGHSKMIGFGMMNVFH